ncbi:MAG: MurR/RpiR family transcriptional regulator [Lachnospiraceae bacterium]|mgnify:CR=1 FL=1|nr:MurR/RpiR family transcriptional regulator [Lachnospiraceae bacterium]
MELQNDIKRRIQEKEQDKKNRFSKGQRFILEYIEKHADKAAFLTAAKLGEAVGVSESTVVRFAIGLGYKGYSEFQRALQEYVKQKLNSIQRIEITSGIFSETSVLESVLNADAEKIKTTLDRIDQTAFERAVDTILSAETIYIIGIRSCAPLASFLGFYLNLIFKDVRILQSSNSSELFEQLLRIGKADVIIGISFPRYSMRTLKALEFANHQGAQVIALTDSPNSPMNQYACCSLLAKSGMASIVDSLVAPLSVINALVAALCMKKQQEVVQTLEALEKIWEEYQIYNNDEIETEKETDFE